MRSDSLNWLSKTFTTNFQSAIFAIGDNSSTARRGRGFRLDLDTVLVFVILGVAVFLFVSEWVSPDIVALLVLVSVSASGLVTTQEALSGMSSSAVAAIIGLSVIGAGLIRSGAIIWAADQLTGLIRGSTRRLTLVSTLGPGLLSSVVNIEAAASVFIPAIMRLARRVGVPPSRLLMPLAFTALAGANLTIIGASHNLVVNSQLTAAGLTGFGFFELTPAGLVFLGLTTVYSFVFAGLLLPSHEEVLVDEGYLSQDELVIAYGMADRLWEVAVLPESEIAGKTLREADLGARFGVGVIAIVRAGSAAAIAPYKVALEDGDTLLIGGREERVRQLVDETGLELLGAPRAVSPFPLSDAELVEVIVPPRSAVIGSTLRDLNFRSANDLTAVAVWHSGRPIRTDVGNHLLAPGDTLLLYGSRASTRMFHPRPDYLWLNPPPEEEAPAEMRHYAPVTGAILLGVIALASLGLMNIGVAALGGAALTILLGILTPRQAYERIGWGTVIMIAGMFPLGIALLNSGGAELISELLIDVLEPFGDVTVLAGVAFITMLLTQPMHNAAVAIIMSPVAIDVAAQLDSNPHAFAAAVIVAASANFLLPVGHPAPYLVKAPGGYQARDYLKFGAGLNALALLMIVIVIPLLWPL
jgi:di/tricarboxylate transporter